VVFGQLLGVQGMVVRDVTVQADPDDDGEILVVSVRPDARSAGRCAQCRRLCPGYDAGVDVPWARPGGKCTYLLEDTCAWLAKNMALTAVTVFLRLSWRNRRWDRRPGRPGSDREGHPL